MIEIIIWIFAYITLYVSVLWLHIFFLKEQPPSRRPYFPKVSLIIPVYNGGSDVEKTIRSLLALDYPSNKKEIIVVDHGSTDNTWECIQKYKNKVKAYKIKRQDGQLKATPLNYALKNVTGELVAAIDADSTVHKKSLRQLVAYFRDNEELGAAICAIKVRNPKNLIERLQWFEYIFNSFMRRLMSSFGTLAITPGVLSVYPTKVIKKIGGFDEQTNLTEDFEIALRLRKNHYDIVIDNNCIGYTSVPPSFNKLYNQRVRWFRGFIHNSFIHKDMFFNRKYGLLGTFQLPLAVISVFMLLTGFSLLAYRVFDKLTQTGFNIVALGKDYLYLLELPELYRFILGMNFKIVFPVALTIFIVCYLFYRAFKLADEKWAHPHIFLFYLFIYPAFSILHWTTAVFKQIFNISKKW